MEKSCSELDTGPEQLWYLAPSELVEATIWLEKRMDDEEKVVLVVVMVEEALVETPWDEGKQEQTGWCWRHSHEQAARSELRQVPRGGVMQRTQGEQ